MEYVSVSDALAFCKVSDNISKARIDIIVPAVNDRLTQWTNGYTPDAYLKLVACKYVDYEFSNMNGLESYSAGEILKFSTDYELKVKALLGSTYLKAEAAEVGIIIRTVR